MLNRLFATTLLVAMMMISMLPANVSAAPGTPPGDSPKPCLKNGQLYPHGSLYNASLYGPAGNLIYTDVYRCTDGKWIYLYSINPNNPQP